MIDFKLVQLIFMLIAIKQLECQACNACVFNLLQTHFIWLVKIMSFLNLMKSPTLKYDIIYTNTVSRDIEILFNYNTFYPEA